MGLRVSRDEGYSGLDIDEHGVKAYSGFQVFTTYSSDKSVAFLSKTI